MKSARLTLLVFGREKRQLPIVFNDAETEFQRVSHAQKEAANIDESESEIRPQRELDRQHNFGVIGRVQSVAVMRLMAGPKGDMTEPTEETENMDEKLVEPLGLEDGLVTKLVVAVDGELLQRAIQINQRNHDQPVRPANGVPGEPARNREHRQECQGLRHALDVAALIQARQIRGRHRRAIKLYPSLLLVFAHHSISSSTQGMAWSRRPVSSSRHSLL